MKKLLIILLFLLLVSMIVFGGYFISLKSSSNPEVLINSYDKSENKYLLNTKFKEYELNEIEDELEETNYDDKKQSYRNRTYECKENYDCGEDYKEGTYCIFDKVYQRVHVYECNGKCSEKTQSVFLEECLMGCSDGKCIDSFPFKCNYDYECGFNDFTGKRYCTENDVHQRYVEYKCENPGNENSFCRIDVSDKLVDECSGNLKCSSGNCVE